MQRQSFGAVEPTTTEGCNVEARVDLNASDEHID